MKTKIFLLSLFLFSLLSYAQSTAFISREKLFSQLKGYTVKQAAADTLKLQLSREVQQQQAGLQKKYQELISPYNPKNNETSEAIKVRMSKMDQEKYKLLLEEQKMQEKRIMSFNMQLEELYKKDLKPYAEKVETVLREYSQKNKIDMIWYLEDVYKALPYYNKSNDITQIIIEMVNKSIP